MPRIDFYTTLALQPFLTIFCQRLYSKPPVIVELAAYLDDYLIMS